MKFLILPLIVLLISGSVKAQIEYESPHVKEGKTMRFTIPKGYFTVENASFGGYAMYASLDGLDLEVDEIEALPVGMIAVMHVAIEDQTLQMFKDELSEELNVDEEGVIVLGEPEIVKVKGRDCMYAGFKGEIDEETIAAIYFGAIEFGDYFILISYLASQEMDDLMSYSDFKKIMSTWSEVVTTKEDEMDDEFSTYEEEEFEDLSIYFSNDLFETEINYYDILPDFGDGWNDVIDESGHLLSLFSYKEENGSVKIFSGGSASNYPSEEEMAKSIELAMDWTKPISLEFNSQFSNEDHQFKLYTISGGGTMSSVYTTVVNNELVFFVVDGGTDPVDNFKPAVREFMLTMWVDYFTDEAEDK